MRHALVVLVVLGSALAGCTIKTVKPAVVATADASATARAPATTIVIGDIKVADTLWEPYRPHVSRGISDWYARNASGLKVLTAKPESATPHTIVIVGTITNLDKGSAALRFIVGMGAGQAKFNGDFEIQTLEGTPLAKFSAREAYLGGAGIGGIGFLDMEDLARRFGETVAETALKWNKGQPLE